MVPQIGGNVSQLVAKWKQNEKYAWVDSLRDSTIYYGGEKQKQKPNVRRNFLLFFILVLLALNAATMCWMLTANGMVSAEPKTKRFGQSVQTLLSLVFLQWFSSFISNYTSLVYLVDCSLNILFCIVVVLVCVFSDENKKKSQFNF